MYKAFREFCERVLRIPSDPEPPPGDHESTRIFRAAPNYYRYLLFIWALGTVGAFIVFCWFSIAPIAGYVSIDKYRHPAAHLLLLLPITFFTILAFLRLFALAVLRLNFEKRWYVVTDRSMRVREGVFNVREMTITFANIQNISVDQGPVQRALGIADLKVETAGGGPANPKHPGQNLHTAYFRGIDNANEVRQLIQERLRRLKDSGLGDHDELHAHKNSNISLDYLRACEKFTWRPPRCVPA
ncbi:MAG TPA: PH domain-containing protein [Candidatus Saccharimonadales bacterium]|nr:PH domain-containing protein [Candidatus Saccharimonadales bacterium]